MELFYGETNSAGEIVRDTDRCILSGRVIAAGDMIVSLPDSPYFIRVSARRAGDVNPDMLKAALTAIRKSNAVEKPRSKGASSAPEIREES